MSPKHIVTITCSYGDMLQVNVLIINVVKASHDTHLVVMYQLSNIWHLHLYSEWILYSVPGMGCWPFYLVHQSSHMPYDQWIIFHFSANEIMYNIVRQLKEFHLVLSLYLYLIHEYHLFVFSNLLCFISKFKEKTSWIILNTVFFDEFSKVTILGDFYDSETSWGYTVKFIFIRNRLL